MIDFFLACAGLFTDTFNAALQLDLFIFLASVLLIQVAFGLWFLIYRGSKKV